MSNYKFCSIKKSKFESEISKVYSVHTIRLQKCKDYKVIVCDKYLVPLGNIFLKFVLILFRLYRGEGTCGINMMTSSAVLE